MQVSQQQKHTDVISGLFFFFGKEAKGHWIWSSLWWRSGRESYLVFGEEAEGRHIWYFQWRRSRKTSNLVFGEETEWPNIWSFLQRRRKIHQNLPFLSRKSRKIPNLFFSLKKKKKDLKTGLLRSLFYGQKAEGPPIFVLTTFLWADNILSWW